RREINRIADSDSSGSSRSLCEAQDPIELRGDLAQVVRLFGVVIDLGRKKSGIASGDKRFHHGRKIDIAFQQWNEMALLRFVRELVVLEMNSFDPRPQRPDPVLGIAELHDVPGS